ncbi:ecto-ADP-ribosyltransferase 4 precursor isoform A [Alligator mississippiensis]|uniref:NAD(P)(+)--arginine ADP-ribosyltransferase n=1 Tax=Alligator mississippiensis TaxID=8496 RepID=A0A151LZ39_ALLMI|nr:ecto-ADP-ribosyltransferase 4 precursor isoform A [Alligator mississippiensis]
MMTDLLTNLLLIFSLEWLAVPQIFMDMAPDSFDDGYDGCRNQVVEDLKQGNYFQKELGAHENYSSIWEKAEEAWAMMSTSLLKEMQENHSIALIAYTMNSPLHSDLNQAISRAGKSPGHYRHNFPFKYLHFYLTTAIQLEAKKFGTETMFIIKTCLGAPVQQFSHYASEREVLIPPYEVFRVRKVNWTQRGNWLRLDSLGNYSKYNCELLKASRIDEPRLWCQGNVYTVDPKPDSGLS